MNAERLALKITVLANQVDSLAKQLDGAGYDGTPPSDENDQDH